MMCIMYVYKLLVEDLHKNQLNYRHEIAKTQSTEDHRLEGKSYPISKEQATVANVVLHIVHIVSEVLAYDASATSIFGSSKLRSH
jgi:hypothetical protein